MLRRSGKGKYYMKPDELQEFEMSLPFNFITLGGLRKILYDLEE
jgi:hypothetical protein